ncbi:MAG TPA: class I SAM-dependent methyltransferase [Bryobacterales bacterium]|jgi:SAM-dependent methyltransferase|nr:class I SAM-dependent methyltransferase [Bryobacterales bacterium]
MHFDLAEYRAGRREQTRVRDLMAILPQGRHSVLDIGARDGYISRLLASRFQRVTALDLEKPAFTLENVKTVKGDVTKLDFPDNSFDVIVCTEVLEHIAPRLLRQACREIVRVVRHEAVIGVPYKQDLRAGRTTCQTCKKKNPPWGHVNSFDERVLVKLFYPLRVARLSILGPPARVTNFVSAFLMDLAGNPWGTYNQHEPCVYCGAPLAGPVPRSPAQRLCSAAAVLLEEIQNTFHRSSPTWIHMVFQKNGTRP